MKFFPLWGRCAAALLLSVSLSFVPIAGQQRRRPAAPPRAQRQTTPPPTPAPPGGVQKTAAPAVAAVQVQQPGAPASVAAAEAAAATVTLDTLFAADDYAVYGEVRSVGQLVSSKEVLDLLAPLKLPGGAPPEALELLDFFTTRAETLATSRIAFGAVPSRAKLPDVLVAVELSTSEQAEKLLPELREFAATKLKSFAKSTTPPDGGAGTNVLTAATETGGRRKRRRPRGAANRPAAPVVAPPPFYLQRSGAVVALSDSPFTFRDLRRPGAKPLSEEPSFVAARSRLSSETLFVYFNVGRFEQVERRQREEYARLAEAQRTEEARKQQQGTNANSDATGAVLLAGDPREIGNSNANSTMIPPDAAVVVGNANSNTAVLTATGEVELPEIVNPEEAGPTTTPLTPGEEAKMEAQRRSQEFEMMLASVLFSGGGPLGGGNSRSGWPEAIGVGAALEGDAVVLRGLFVNASDEQPLRPIPFLPIVLSGPSLVPEAAGVLPADTDILVSASLDLPQMYDYLASSLRLLDFAGSAVAGKQGGQFDAQLSAFEKDKGFRIKEDLLNSLGNEIAISVPAQWFGGGNMRRQNAAQKKSKRPPQNSPVFLIALNDKKKLQEILPRALASVGLAGVSEQQLIEKRGNVELLTFTQGTVAFIEQFLVVAPDAETMRWIADSYNERETLASSARFREAVNWQPRQAVGQIYVSSEVLQLVLEDPRQAAEDIDEESISNLLARRPAEPGAITHVTIKDDRQLIHELRLPKNFLSMLAADLIISQKLAPVRGNESQARWKLHSLAAAQSAYKEATGRYASLTELETSDARPEYQRDEKYEVEGYEIKLSVSGDKFEATATPTVYRKTGRLSFYIDQTSVIRGGDLNGKAATAADEPVN